MSLNSRIAIRDTYETRGAVVNCHVVTRLRFNARPETTRDTIILEPEKPRTDLMKQLPLLPDGEAKERVNSKSCVRHSIVLSYVLSSSRDRRHRVTSTIRTGDISYGLQAIRLFETAVIYILSAAIFVWYLGACRLPSRSNRSFFFAYWMGFVYDYVENRYPIQPTHDHLFERVLKFPQLVRTESGFAFAL